MAYPQYLTISVATTSSGDSSHYSTGAFTGYVDVVAHTAVTASMSTACGFTVATEKGLTVLNLAAASSSWTYYPRAAVAKTTGTSTEFPTMTPIPLKNERLVVTLSSNTVSTGCATTVRIWLA